MSEIDTEEIRERTRKAIRSGRGKADLLTKDIPALCDALDDARTVIRTLNLSCSNWERAWVTVQAEIRELREGSGA